MGRWIFGGITPVSDDGGGPLAHQRGARGPVPSAHHRPGYPLSGCVPAEPDSVSPGGPTVTSTPATNKSNGLEPISSDGSAKCTPEPRWVPFARRCGSLLLADYQRSPTCSTGTSTIRRRE